MEVRQKMLGKENIVKWQAIRHPAERKELDTTWKVLEELTAGENNRRFQKKIANLFPNKQGIQPVENCQKLKETDLF